MAQIHVTFPDGAVRQYDAGITIEDIAGSISSSLKKKAVAGKKDGKVVDLYTELTDDAAIEIVTLDSADGLEVYRHSTAHLLAQAVKRIYGAEVKFGIGPVIEDGFYYDMDIPVSLSPEDLGKIEAEMEKIVKEDLPIRRKVVSREEATTIFQELNDHLKLELIRDLPEDAIITLYEQGEFFDLCRGPHLPSTGFIKAFKLMSVAGAYWRGKAENQVLQRVYGTAWPKKADMDEYLHFIEEAKKRDHRKLGKELGLFMFSEEAPGMPFYLPKGFTVRNELEQFSRRLQQLAQYTEVRSPFLMNERLWKESGHWDHYKENMYFSEVDNATYALKPMNCPGHMLIYKNEMHSYRDLPIRYSEFGQVHRHEYSGALNGMLRVRTFCQDDAHVFVRPDQIASEIKGMITLIDSIYKVFGFEYSVALSTRPEDSMGSDELWEAAESSLKTVLDELGMAYEIKDGDGAFYGPKIDFQITDALKRRHQCGTIQLDFQMPEKFDLTYVGQDNEKHRPVVLHRAMYGSMERFIGILIEHYAGAFPIWLTPIQARIMNISEVHMPYAEQVREKLQQAGIRVELDGRNEKIGYKIREAQVEKIPYMLVIGEKEVADGTLSVRKRGVGDEGAMTVDAFVEKIRAEINEMK
ncbi:threonine--tRNA ligase [Brevibacillus porteri]|uniref:Threonine--tRNA ligase n=1 Tax=Brevibacillus porteri TaxID=2126350 RepID=A0ABX5FWX1_9BACL|nr:threonine--tRNA ligase [Brevibacillus porteri]MED1800933.1 threonine--tRNA ligase [Brevibacillus porteri]MED2130319.1 threonine--tRNA ligase [Brevibacillus porteri]MED2742838.1 threonine--tRNA ligase [Brevibacillus porteri]MED2817282.1 threonine--tRNA ligase [Brevibacillus porteri]MED2895946.1 threonine--tRNA ligase [Brevibacillus porteri]